MRAVFCIHILAAVPFYLAHLPHRPGSLASFSALARLGVYLLAGNRKTGQLVFGLALLFAGLAFLAGNLWDFNLLRSWPVLLILWGIVLVLQRGTAR